MASIWGFISRNWTIFNPPIAKKADNALKFGMLGAANIGPMAFIIPAKNHPEVVIQAVAARDEKKAAAYAKKHGIPEVKKTYQDILDDPSIDCVYIPLPNGLHYEWALKALKAGKHVLLEKPSVSNAIEAERLFRSPLVTGPDAPVLLEAFHYRFQPCWQYFLTLLDRPNLATVRVEQSVPAMAFPADDIRFRYELAGGCMMDFGTYTMNCMRQIWAAEPEECVRADLKVMPAPQEAADYAFDLQWRMPGDGVAHLKGNLRATLSEAGGFSAPKIWVTHREARVEDSSLPTGQEKFRTRKIAFFNYICGAFYHSITIEDDFVIRKASGEVVKRWKEKVTKKAYTFEEVGMKGSGEVYWTTWRHQLEQFVNRVRGRKTTTWVDSEDSIAQMKVIDLAYQKAGLPLRPTSNYE